MPMMDVGNNGTGENGTGKKEPGKNGTRKIWHYANLKTNGTLFFFCTYVLLTITNQGCG